MPSISAMNVKIGGDASEAINAINLTIAELRRAQRYAAMGKTAAMKYQEGIDAVSRSLAKGKIKHQEYVNAMRYLVNKYKRTGQELKKTKKSHLGYIKAVAGGIAVFQAWKAVSSIARAGMDAQAERARMKAFLGSSEAADEMFTKVRDIAAQTPVTLDAVAKSATMLLSARAPMGETLQLMQDLSNASGGNSERFKFLAKAFMDARNSGRLMGQEAKQMVNAGFSPLNEIAKETGETVWQVKKRMEQGRVSYQELIDALHSATTGMGTFAGVADAVANTAQGQFSIMESKFQSVADTIWQKVEPAMVSMAKTFNSFLTTIDEGLPKLDKTTIQIVASAAAFTATVFVVRKVIKIIKEMVEAYRKLATAQAIQQALSGPQGWVMLAAGAAAAAAAVYGVNKAFDAYASNSEKVAEGHEAIAEQNESIASAMSMMQEAVPTGPKGESFDTVRSRYVEQIRLVKMGQEGLEKWKILQMDITEGQKKQLLAYRQTAKRLKATQEAQEEHAKRMEQLREKGKSLMETHDPVQKVAEQIADLNVLLRANAIDQATYFRERNKVLRENIKTPDMDQPESMEAGSASAASFIQKVQAKKLDQQIKKLEAIRLQAAAHVEIARRTEQKLDDLTRVEATR